MVGTIIVADTDKGGAAMKVYGPDFFKDFHCIGSECRDNCCKMGWDIEIDDATYRYYRSLDCGLCEHISDDGSEHYIRQQDGQCPFLDENGLCSVVLKYGEEHISEICTEHPRFYRWFGDYKEAGTGLCCEESVRLWLSHAGSIGFCEWQTDEAPDDLEFDSEIFAAVKNIREKLIDIAQDRGFTIMQRLALLCYCAEDISEALQEEDCEQLKKISGMLAIDGFRMEIVIQAEKDILSGDVRAMGKDGLERLFSLFSQMEYMGSLGERFSLTEDIRDKMLSEEKAFSENYAAYQHELENILVYFLYRYFIKCTRDYAAEERLFTAVYMTLAARGLFLREYAEKGVLPDLDRRILLVKELSKEVEYDSDNMDIIYDEIQQSADTRDMLCGLCF